jgi:hypothetical protein
MMAKTYGMLPSEVQARATTFDVMVMDVMAAWEKHLDDRANGRISTPDVDTATLEEILKKAKG